MLVLEVEFLSGVCFAATGPDSQTSDWPPQPDRVFSALVAAWAARGEDALEARSLEWLERQPPPRVDASDAAPRTGAVAFVPPNDPRSDRRASAAGVMPAFRRRQPRSFPAARPWNATVRYCWRDTELDEETFSSLGSLARDTAYVGHSASLTRCRFLRAAGDTVEDRGSGSPRRRVYPGRLAELRRQFQAGRRPSPGEPVAVTSGAEASRVNAFGQRWLLLEHIAGEMPDIRACAIVGKAVRDIIVDGYRRTGLGHLAPEVVSGLTSTGEPSRDQHVAIVPLPFAGVPFADGQVLGFAIVPPAGSTILDDPGFRRALRCVAPLDAARGRRTLSVRVEPASDGGRAFVPEFSLSIDALPARRSLDPGRYTRAARSFATVTPIALDRHLKAYGAAQEGEIHDQVAQACLNIGLPRPELVVADKHCALEGAPPARSPAKVPAWMEWRRPGPLKSRRLTHAVLRFAEAVPGPVILGAGRFLGLGLCLPVALADPSEHAHD